MMIGAPLIRPGNRKMIGYNKPVIRIYKNEYSGIVLINKAGCRHADLSAGNYINLHYTCYGLAILKHSELSMDGYLLRMDCGRLRFYTSKEEVRAMMTWFKSEKRSTAFIIGNKFELDSPGIICGYKLTEVL